MARRFVYSEAHLAYLRQEYQRRRIADLTDAFNVRFGLNKSTGCIKAALKNHRITANRPPGFFAGERSMLTPAMVEWLTDAYRRLPLKDLTREFNARYSFDLNPKALHAHLKRRGIHSGRSGRIKKGNTPWNTGTRGLVKPNSGNFKKGHVPGNIRALGSERICPKDGFILVKVDEPNPYTSAKTRFKHKHLVIWERAHGPVPDGHVVTFIDGDKLNCALDNLECISRSELARRNKLRLSQAPDEVKPTIKAIARLQMVAHDRGQANG